MKPHLIKADAIDKVIESSNPKDKEEALREANKALAEAEEALAKAEAKAEASTVSG